MKLAKKAEEKAKEAAAAKAKAEQGVADMEAFEAFNAEADASPSPSPFEADSSSADSQRLAAENKARHPSEYKVSGNMQPNKAGGGGQPILAMGL